MNNTQNTQKIVINECFGGFGLSHQGVMCYAKLKKMKVYPYLCKSNSIKLIESPNDCVYDCIHYATKKVKSNKELNKNYFNPGDIARDDQFLIQTVKDLGEKSWGCHAELKIVEIPAGVDWSISEYDGIETIDEAHRSWS